MRNCILDLRGYQLELGSKSYLMGILNLTPDSFSDGGDYASVNAAIGRAKSMVLEGAAIIDIGGESTRPGHLPIDEEEEFNRVAPVLEQLLKEVDVPLSIDTYKASVAQKALEKGIHMVNDIWGLQKDKEMATVIAQYEAPVVVMHNQDHTNYSIDIMESIKYFLAISIEIAIKAGIKERGLILDPGIGFGKNFEQNLQVLSRLHELQDLGYPLLLGTSRKSVIGNILTLPPKERVEGTIATTILGITKGVDIFRVHDIKENFRAIQVADRIVRNPEVNHG